VKKFVVVFVILTFMMMIPAVALAQDGGPLPETATQGLALAATMLAAFGGLLASMATDWLKSRKWKWLTADDQTKIQGWIAAFVTGVFSIAAGLLLNYGAKFAADLDTTGVWQVILTVGPWLFAEIRYRWRASAA
jgi:hypothetical protein